MLLLLLLLLLMGGSQVRVDMRLGLRLEGTGGGVLGRKVQVVVAVGGAYGGVSGVAGAGAGRSWGLLGVVTLQELKLGTQVLLCCG